MGYSKVDYNGETLMDISNDTVTPETLAEGATAHNANGDPITGIAKIDMLVTGELDPSNFEVTTLDKEYDEIETALLNNKEVRLLLNIPLGGEHYASVVGNVEIFRPTYGMIDFGVVIDTALDGTNNEQVYHFKITYTSSGSISTERKQVSGESGGQTAVSPIVTVTPIEGGNLIVITDAEGDKPFYVMNGPQGPQGETGPQGPQGEQGKDYVLTDSDKSNIADIVLGKLPTWNGGSY